MNKKLMAVAVASVLSVPGMALAQVQIGGSLTVFYYQHKPDNPGTGQSGDILEPSEPEMYIRGEEKLGGGTSAWFQCTSSLDGMITGAAASAGLCGRNSGVGFKGSFGNLFAGNWDAPQKLVFNQARGWWGGTNAFTGGSAVLLNGGSASGATNPTSTTSGVVSVTGGVATAAATQITSNAPGAFFRRQAASLNYHSPNWGGFSVNGAYSANNESTGIPESSTLTPRMYSLGANFRAGPVIVAVGYEQHSDYNPANVAAPGTAGSAYSGGDDTNYTVVVGFQTGAFSIRGLYSNSEYETTNTTKLDVDGYGLFADWRIAGPHTLRAQYVEVGNTGGNSAVNVGSYKGSAGAGCGAASATSCAGSTGAKLYGVAYSYAFSKRTEGSIAYSSMDNDPNASYSKGKTAATAGNTQTTAGVVLKHRF